MSDYTTPAVSDESVKYLAEEIGLFSRDVREQIGNINATIDRYYTVDHEPKIELPFEGEYDYIYNKVNDSLSDKDLKEIPHIFLSGYLKSGDTITFKPYSNNVKEQDNYSAFYINGAKVWFDSQKQYICKAEEGAREKLNILILGCPKVSNIYKARFVVDYADIPLEDFKMVLYDDVDEPINPDIDSFLASKQIDTLKVIGNLVWRYSGLCTLRRLELTKDITVSSTMYCPCLQELIIPNVANVPDINADSLSKSAIVKLDITNVRGNVDHLHNMSCGEDLVLKCATLRGFNGAQIARLYTGDYCNAIYNDAVSNTTVREVYIGRACASIGDTAFSGCKALRKVVFSNLLPCNIYGYNTFFGCTALTDISFAYISKMVSTSFGNCTALANLTFTESISTNLYFGSSPSLTEQSCLNIINAIAGGAKISVALHSTVKTCMANDWYCRLVNGVYVSCTSEDEGAMLQMAALIARGGTLA